MHPVKSISRIYSILLVGLAALVLTACGGGGGGGATLDATGALDATGVWNATTTVTGLSPFVTNGCVDNDPVSTVSRMYLTMTQTGTNLTAKTVTGDVLSGSIDAAGAFTLNGVSTWADPFTGDVDTDTLSVSGTLSSATVWTGTATITEAFTPSGGRLANQCTETVSLASAFVYKHTGSEDYDGVYAFEAEVEEDGVASRQNAAIEFEISGSSLNTYSRSGGSNGSDGAEVVTVNSYEPATGFFSVRTVNTRDFASGSQVSTDNFTGIFVRAPGDGSGSQVSVAIDSYGETRSGPGGTGTTIGTHYDLIEAYGKRVSTQAFTRSVHYRPSGGGGDNDDVLMGLAHPPLKGDNTKQYLEVLDTDGSTRLCTGTFDRRFRAFQYLPVVDVSTEQFQTKAYSAITCNTFSTGIRVVDGMNYTDGYVKNYS